jgi:hypothetical protein
LGALAVDKEGVRSIIGDVRVVDRSVPVAEIPEVIPVAMVRAVRPIARVKPGSNACYACPGTTGLCAGRAALLYCRAGGRGLPGSDGEVRGAQEIDVFASSTDVVEAVNRRKARERAEARVTDTLYSKTLRRGVHSGW